ncbi:MAG: pimeloyl-ACP methyl ester carboxylesterase [Roseivirga sp.]|jgi:pimeloyl-ACP methyl ester carboxylesterase
MKLSNTILKATLLGIVILATVIVSLYGYRDIPLEELKTKYAPAPSAFISVKGMDVHFRDEGNSADSIPIVLLHGTGSSLHTFEDWTIQLKQDYRIIRMDLPAYGLTGPFPGRNYSIDNYVDFLLAFLKSAGVKKCVLAGNSLGGNIAWSFTLKYPAMVDKLILIDASGYPVKTQSLPLAFRIAQTPIIKNVLTFITPRFIAKSSVENVYADKNKVTEALVDRYFELTLRAGNRRAFVDKFEMKKDSLAPNNIKSIQQKTLLLWGGQDLLIPVEVAQQFHNDLPNDTLVIMPNVGHLPMEESPGQSLEAVVSFLKDPL